MIQFSVYINELATMYRTEGGAFNDNDDSEPVEDEAVTNSFASEEHGDGISFNLLVNTIDRESKSTLSIYCFV